ncbi:hypothetical protein LZ645_01120 [Shewanella algae]|uniref:hypothetical protein n=1 Tax=Shewanella algae TaxID=38313 RepID=UPI001F438CEA|nr:hypothetical protein [Shewanella algae]MCE9773546.1 hypothetical protein [Shewanella algae]
MDMPTPCPECGDIVELDDMVGHPENFRVLVCEDCRSRIEDENNRGEHTDAFNNKLEWIATPDDGLIEFKVNGEDLTTWSFEDDPEVCFADFLSIWNKAQELSWQPLSSPPQESGRYTVHSSYGVRDAYFTTGLTQGDFRWQDCETGNDEGMQNMEGVVYQVFSWTYMPTPDTNGGDK